MANPYAGEVALTVNGVRHVMKLTLGALAELEAELGAESLVAVVERFEAGSYRTRDVLFLLKAGLRGGGWDGDLETLAAAEISGGPVHAARAAALLLARAFALPNDQGAP
jgi:hypothetical protein